MFTFEMLKGICVGVILASLTVILSRPAPILELNAPSQVSLTNGLLVTDLNYDRLSPIPTLSLKKGKELVLHHAIRRVEMEDGSSGIRIILMMEPTRKMQFI